MQKQKVKIEKIKKVKEKLDVSFTSLMLKLALTFVFLASFSGFVLSVMFPTTFSFNPYKQALKLTDETVKKWFDIHTNTNFSFKASTYKQYGLFLTKDQENQIVAKFNDGKNIGKITDEIEELARFLNLKYTSTDLLYQDQIVTSSIRLMPIIIDNAKTDEDGGHSYGDVSISKENKLYTVTAHHIYLVYLKLKDETSINLKKYITFDLTKNNIKWTELLKLANLPFVGNESAIVDKIYYSLFENINSNMRIHQKSYTLYFDSTSIKTTGQIKNFFKINTATKERKELWNKLNNLKLSINIVPGSEEFLSGLSGDKLLSNDYEGDEVKKPLTNEKHAIEYKLVFEVNETTQTYKYRFIPKPFIKPPTKPPTK